MRNTAGLLCPKHCTIRQQVVCATIPNSEHCMLLCLLEVGVTAGAVAEAPANGGTKQ